MCGPALMLFNSNCLVANLFVRTCRNNIRPSRTVSIYFRQQFAQWFNIDCFSLYNMKSHFPVPGDTPENSPTFTYIMSFWTSKSKYSFHLASRLRLYFDIAYNMKKQQLIKRLTTTNNCHIHCHLSPQNLTNILYLRGF